MAKTIFLNNLIENGNFETGINNWTNHTNLSLFSDSIEHYIGNKSLKVTLSNPNVLEGYFGYTKNINFINSHKYYCCAFVKSSKAGKTSQIYFPYASPYPSTATYINTDWTKMSFISYAPNMESGLYSCRYDCDNGREDIIMWFDGISIIDLTASFGLGNEPTQEWCDNNIPYFDNEYEIKIPDKQEQITKEFVDIYNSKYISLIKASTIKPKFKIELLDLYENTIGEITKDISATNSGNISINYQQGVRRSCSFTLSDTFGKYRPMSNDNIFGFNTKFKVYVGLEDIQTGIIYWFSQGIFYTTNPSSSHANSSKTVTVNGVDKFGIFTSDTGYNQLEGTYIIPAKSKLYAVVKDILSLELGNGYIIDPKEPRIDAQFINYELPYDIKKSPGSYMGDILIELGNVLGADIYYDTNGILVISSGTTDITYSQQSSIWDFSDTSLEYSNGSVSLNTIDAINIVKVIGNQINNSEIFVGSAENHNPLSATAIEKIGRKMYYEDSANLPNQARADEYAKYILNTKSIIQTAINFGSCLIPHLDVNRVITITDKYYQYEQERFIIQSITLPLDTKTLMQISCNNISSLPYYDLRNGG